MECKAHNCPLPQQQAPNSQCQQLTPRQQAMVQHQYHHAQHRHPTGICS